MRRPCTLLATCQALWLALFAPCWATSPENLAKAAAAEASSEHGQAYRASFAIDGRIPAAGSTVADRGTAWCVLKSKAGDEAEFVLRWPHEIHAAELVYWGRTAWSINDCWKDYELYLDATVEPAVRGSFTASHGPQRVALPAIGFCQLRLKFRNSHGGPNPGASEIQVFARAPSRAELDAIAKAQTVLGPDQLPYRYAPPKAEVDSVASLVKELSTRYGESYAAAASHRTRLVAPTAAVDVQREALLFDVDQLLLIKRHEIAASHVYTYHYEGFRAGGGLYLAPVGNKAGPPRCLVDAQRGQILDADLSHDARRVVFSWRREESEGYHLWLVNIDGSGLTQLTRGQWHDYNTCWLPDGGLAFLSTRWPQFAYCWHAPVGVLCRMNIDGSGFQRLSANYLNDFTPSVLDDGRIIYTRWEYVDRPAIPIQSLWTMNPDGTCLAGYFGNRKISPATFMEARAVPGTQKILCTMTGHNGPARGAIGLLDRSRGVNAQEAIENLTPEVKIPKIDEGNGNTSGAKPYSGPYPLDATRFLCAARGPIVVRTIDGRCQSIAVPAPEDGQEWFSPQPLRSRIPPPVITPRVERNAPPTATVYLQDVYNGLEPQVRRGDVTAIRVVREMPKAVRIDPRYRAFGFQFPVISCGATYAPKQVLGETPVAADGSACFRVPAGIPVYFMALDAEGRAVQRMRSFTHFMPGEVQGCIGCHESRLRGVSQRPNVTRGVEPRELIPPDWGTDGFDYSRIVQPVLDRYCVQCHNPTNREGGFDLCGDKTDYFNVSYELLARERAGKTGSPLVKWIPTFNGQEWNILEITPKFWGSPASKLADLILAGHPDAAGKRRVSVDLESRRRLFAWIDLNVPYYGTSETAYPERRGSRQILPDDLDMVLADVGRRRCAECHAEGKFPRREWTRITRPEYNAFLMAPLSKSDGCAQQCGRAVFADRSDPDYQAILRTFAPVQEMLRYTPRMDMPGAKPAPDACRICQ